MVCTPTRCTHRLEGRPGDHLGGGPGGAPGAARARPRRAPLLGHHVLRVVARLIAARRLRAERLVRRARLQRPRAPRLQHSLTPLFTFTAFFLFASDLQVSRSFI